MKLSRIEEIMINEEQLKTFVKSSVEEILHESSLTPKISPNNGRKLLNEMARLNKRDGSASPFPSNKYKIWVQGDNSPHKPAHIHISYAQDGWQIKVLIENGKLWQVVNYGNRGRTDTFTDVLHMVQEWFLLTTTMPGRVGTNKDAAMNEWDACNDE